MWCKTLSIFSSSCWFGTTKGNSVDQWPQFNIKPTITSPSSEGCFTAPSLCATLASDFRSLLHQFPHLWPFSIQCVLKLLAILTKVLSLSFNFPFLFELPSCGTQFFYLFSHLFAVYLFKNQISRLIFTRMLPTIPFYSMSFDYGIYSSCYKLLCAKRKIKK